MKREEAQLWLYGLHMWVILFVIIVLRVSPVAELFGMAVDPAQTLAIALTTWAAGGGLSLAFLLRARSLNELDDLTESEVTLRMLLSIPLGIVAVIHTIYQIRSRGLTRR
jgi:hypothetical protein